MKKEEALIELAQLINKLRNECLTGDQYLPMCDVRRYNELVHDLWGDELGEDPEILEALSKKEKTTRWIPVTERLPEPKFAREWYLVSLRSGCVKTLAFEKGGRTDNLFRPGWHETASPVTHWMPLPQPPKEGE